jgi:UDP-N-acetylmuramoylalanine--D-glutamate ligase
MIITTAYSGKTVGVLGLGRSGNATVAALAAGGAKVVMWDDVPNANKMQDMAFHSARAMPPEQWPWGELAAFIISPGIPLTHPAAVRAREMHCPILGDIELLYESCPQARYIGITGTNGKSTTTALIGHILTHAGLKPQVGGNLGTAALSLSPLGEGGTYVLEMSSYQLDLLQRTKFDIAVHLNLSPDHLERHGDMDGYLAAKRHIFDRQGNNDMAVVGIDDAYSEGLCRALIAEKTRRVIPISAMGPVQQGVFAQGGNIISRLEKTERVADISRIPSLRGAHNGQNAAASYAVCLAYGLSHEAIVEAMQSFPGLPHRMQWLGTIGGVQFVNDSKATNSDAAEKALLTYDPIYWIAGGVAKEGGIESLLKYAPRIAHAFLIGEAEEMFAQVLEGHVPYTRCGTMEAAFAQAALMARKEGKKDAAVVLAPACASFDQYKNFEERGAHFVRLVEELRDGK